MMEAAQPIIRLAGVTRRFGGQAALDGVSLDLRDGEFFCLLGPSGCGKSTLLRAIAGFETPDAGRIELDGRDLVAVPPHRRPLNMMFQSYALFPHLRVGANVAYGLRRAGLPRRETAAQVAEMLRLVGLDDLEERYPAQLSGGQRQRVALARALARRPRVLLLDEPLAALDRNLRARTRLELKDLQARLGTTFVMVTHDQDEAMSMADRIGLMDRGRLVQVGPPRELYERPASRFAAEFLGEANLFEGVLVEHGDGLARIRLAGGFEVTAEAGPAPRAGDAVGLAVRPERLHLLADTEPGLPARVIDAAFLGADMLVRSEIEGGAVVRSLVPMRGAAIRPPARGERVRLAFAPADAIVLEG